MPYGLLAQQTIMVVLGGALLYWSKRLAHGLNAWSADQHKKFPILSKLPGSQNADSELNYRTTLFCFRICGALLLAAGVILTLAVFLVLHSRARMQ